MTQVKFRAVETLAQGHTDLVPGLWGTGVSPRGLGPAPNLEERPWVWEGEMAPGKGAVLSNVAMSVSSGSQGRPQQDLGEPVPLAGIPDGQGMMGAPGVP